MRTYIAKITVCVAFSLLLVPSLSSARRGPTVTMRNQPTVQANASHRINVRGDMTRIEISVNARGKSATAARRRVGSVAHRTERAVQSYMKALGKPKAHVVKGPLGVNGRYDYNSRWSYRRDDGSASQKIAIEFKGTSSVAAAKVIDFAMKAAQGASGKGKNTKVDISVGEANNYLSKGREVKALRQLGRQLRFKARSVAGGMLYKGEKLGKPSKMEFSNWTYNPWRGGGQTISANLKAVFEKAK